MNLLNDAIFEKKPINNLKRDRRKLMVKLKTSDGSVLRGNIYLRPTFNRMKDELNDNDETFIALTNVYDLKGNTAPGTFLVNYSNIIYIAADDSDSQVKKDPGVTQLESRILKKRKVRSIIRLKDRSFIRGNIFVRNTVNRAKDEINCKEDTFIAVADVQEQEATPEDSGLIYFVNKNYVIYFSVFDDSLKK